ncbi:SpoIIE family protein phosphatase [Streptomyces sp. enrichment culture]|uniref:ATP-binding SpoIIE family protein phosphatase n=1 Tax=Streptomyces sp. enrichment culture TaxID=1795815 RepID=UPI003F57F186
MVATEPEIPQQRDPAPPDTRTVSGRIPLAVAVVDPSGRISHWSSGAGKLFGVGRDEALGRVAAEIVPVTGVLDAPGYPTAGRFRTHGQDGGGERRGSGDILWWTYPLPGPGAVLVLATDATPLRAVEGTADEPGEKIGAGFARHTDFDRAEDLARGLPEIMPGMSPQESGVIVERVLELGYPVLELSRHARVPVTPDWGVPRRTTRRARLLRAVTEAGAARDERALAAAEADLASDLEYAAVRERLEFLNEVSSRIGSSLDLGRTIEEVGRAVVPRFTDVAGTYLREQVIAGEGFPDGPPDTSTMWHRVAVEHTDEPGRWDDVVPVGESMTFPAHTPFFQCMTSGEPVLVPRVTEEMGHAIAAQFEKRDIRPLITHRSMLVVPLKARQVVLGFMILLRHRERPEFHDMDRVTGAELAARAGLVLDNARMYTYQENVADTLQDSMLPRVEPRTPGCDTATRYLPGTRLGRVGGDWFDTIRLPGCRTALVVGDVMGHGLHSAAMMGQLRTAVQTMAAMDTEPARLLRSLDDLAQRLGDHYLATCLYAVYDPVRGELRIANAGHIPPVLVRAGDGRSELLELPSGAPIGVGRVAFASVTVPVSPGDRLVMCTDGLIEVRGQDIGAGLAALCESAAHPAASMDAACDTIIRTLAAATTPEDRRDDVALLMARLNGVAAEDTALWRLAAAPEEAGRARRLVRDQLRRWGLAALVDTAELLVSEVVTNAVRHARTGPVRLRLVRCDALLCEVADDGHELPVLLNARESDEAGRGLSVVSRLAAGWGTSRTDRGKTVWFELPLPAGGRGGARGRAAGVG